MGDNEALEAFLHVVSGIELVLCLALAGVLVRRWREGGSHAVGSAFGVFAVVALVIAASFVQPDDMTRGWGAIWSDLLVCVLLSIPYLLVRFTWALGGLGDRTHLAFSALLGLEWLVTLALPALPEEGEPRPGWVLAYVVFALAAWSAQCLAAAGGLWRAGRGQSAVVRHRMRSLSIGGLLLALTLVLSGAAGTDTATAFQIAMSLLGLVSIVLFAVAFLPPPVLRLLWRQADVAALTDAERGLMRALTRDEVARTIVPVLGAVLGGGGAALLDEHARPVHTVRLSEQQTAEMAALLGGHPDGRKLRLAHAGLLTSQLTHGWLVVQAGRLAPVFGDDEVVLLERVGTLVDLALQRVRLFEQEQVSRRAAEAAHDELETLLYSVSHDLRSPLISVLGYLDVLRQEHGTELPGEAPHYLERISVNAVYMQSLISDLLELSRIGRSDPAPERLDLDTVARQVADGARLNHPRADVRVVGVLPVVWMSDVRARQLLTNLVDNALRHGGRDDVRITVEAGFGDEGRLLLRVADDGRGVPTEYRERVLRVFERLDAARSSTGTGMGLAICKRIVESFGGSLEIGDPPAGAASGTTVAIGLPPGMVIEPRLPEQRAARDGAAGRTKVEGRR